MGEHTLTIDKFFEAMLMDITLYGKLFLENMLHEQEEKTFCEWMELFLSWMEWDKDDCKQFYGED